MSSSRPEGWRGWDEYAAFYDWENQRTLGRRDVAFWVQVADKIRGRVLELGCGTGRVALPLVRSGVRLVGVDRSAAMLARAAGKARRRATSARRRRVHLSLVRSDIRALPFRTGAFGAVLAPYGVLQSLVRDKELTSVLASVARVLSPRGLFGIDLVPDVPRWREYRGRMQMRGPAGRGRHLTLFESVRHDRRRGLTTFEQCYVERRGRSAVRHRFDLTFRTLPIESMRARLEGAGFSIEAVLGDYRGGAWDQRADVWIILARKVGPPV